MGLVLSHWDDTESNVTDLELTCPARNGCTAGGHNKFRKLAFAQDGSTEAEADDLVDMGPASSVSLCGEGCSACNKF
jgi:hypothetical protein